MASYLLERTRMVVTSFDTDTCGTLHKGRKTDEGKNFLVFGKLKRHRYAQKSRQVSGAAS